jgi:hypothetical protein
LDFANHSYLRKGLYKNYFLLLTLNALAFFLTENKRFDLTPRSIFVPYKPKKDEILITTLEGINNLFLFIDSRVEECLDGQSDSYVEFAKFLKNERITPLLDISDTAQSFTNILLGVKR